MGTDKSRLIAPTSDLQFGQQTLAERTAALLLAVAAPVLEVGGDATVLEKVPDPVPFAGPLAAFVHGGESLRRMGHDGPILLVATDLPWLSQGLLRWLSDHPTLSALLPLDAAGRRQPLCARYPAGAVNTAQRLASSGQASMFSLIEAIAGDDATGVVYAPHSQWGLAGGRPGVLNDVDRPGDLERRGPNTGECSS